MGKRTLAYRIEYNVIGLTDFGKILFSVINNLISSQRFHQFKICAVACLLCRLLYVSPTPKELMNSSTRLWNSILLGFSPNRQVRINLALLQLQCFEFPGKHEEPTQD